MPKIVNTALKAKAKAWTFEAKATGPKAKAKAIKFGLEAPRGQGLASRTTSLCKEGHTDKFIVILLKRSIIVYWYRTVCMMLKGVLLYSVHSTVSEDILSLASLDNR